MNTKLTTLAFLTGGIVILGKWTSGKGFDTKTAIGVGFYAIGLSAFSSFDQNVATNLALLVFVGAVLANWTNIGKGLGLSK